VEPSEESQQVTVWIGYDKLAVSRFRLILSIPALFKGNYHAQV
jgi:hypothetical protein